MATSASIWEGESDPFKDLEKHKANIEVMKSMEKRGWIESEKIAMQYSEITSWSVTELGSKKFQREIVKRSNGIYKKLNKA